MMALDTLPIIPVLSRERLTKAGQVPFQRQSNGGLEMRFFGSVCRLRVSALMVKKRVGQAKN